MGRGGTHVPMICASAVSNATSKVAAASVGSEATCITKHNFEQEY